MSPIALALPWLVSPSPALVAQAPSPTQLDSLWDMLVRGGPIMIPLAVCSVVALGWMLDRAMKMRWAVLGSRTQSEQIVAAARDQGAARALETARAKPTVLGRVLEPAFERWSEDRPAVEKAVEDAGSREVRALMSSLRPLTVIAVIAPLLGLLGTIVGIIIAFRDIALSDAIGKPEALAKGIAQALITTATGLAIAIPTQASYYWFRGRIDRFWKLVEETGERLFVVHAGRRTVSATGAAPLAPGVPAEPPPPPVDPTLAPISMLAQGRP